MGDVNLFIQLFAVGAFVVFLGFGLATLVLMIHLTSLPERRPTPRPQPRRRSAGVLEPRRNTVD